MYKYGAIHHSGFLAYQMGFSVDSNPYSGVRSDLWRKGYRNAEFLAGGKSMPKIRKTYSLLELDDVECPNCGDVYPEDVKCVKCTLSGVINGQK